MTSSLTRRDEKESLPARPMPEPIPEAKNRKKERRNSKINETTYATCFCTFWNICRSSTKIGKTMYSPIKQYVGRFLGVLSLDRKKLDRLSFLFFTQGTKIFQYCTCPAGRVTYNFHLSCKHMHLSFKSECNKEHKGVICNMNSSSNSSQSTRPKGRVFWEELLVLSRFHS